MNLAVLRRAAPQRGFELGLVKRHEFGMPVDVAERVDPTELAELRRKHAHIGNRDLVEIAVLESGQLQNSERLVVQRDGPRGHEDLFVFVHRQDAHAVPSQEIGDRRADRPVSDHQNVDVRRNVRGGRRIAGLARSAISACEAFKSVSIAFFPPGRRDDLSRAACQACVRRFSSHAAERA